MGRSSDNGIRRNNGNPIKIDEKDDGKVKRQWDQEKQLKSDQNKRKRQWDHEKQWKSDQN